ncbi:Ig-like domain-containing protein [Gracilibacillus dipsosauri]|uniref:Ig-like domain-containing protein n=1 Tax=Gracilibacillus dipsosauri TaxID=178340 RepID=UPI00240A8C00
MAYNIYQNDELIANTESKEYTVEGLTPNTEYSFSISEVIGDKESELSDPITVTTDYSAVESVAVAPKTNNLQVGATRNLTSTIEPSTARQDVAWSSDNVEVATVSNGTVTAVAPGTATITATAEGQSDTATVNVTEPEPDPDETE